MLMSEKQGWKAEIDRRIKSRPSIEDIILRQLYGSPKTIGQLQNAIGHHRKSVPSRPGMIRRLNRMQEVERINTLYPVTETDLNLKCTKRILYGIRDLIEADLDSDDPNEISYLNGVDYFHNIKRR